MVLGRSRYHLITGLPNVSHLRGHVIVSNSANLAGRCDLLSINRSIDQYQYLMSLGEISGSGPSYSLIQRRYIYLRRSIVVCHSKPYLLDKWPFVRQRNRGCVSRMCTQFDDGRRQSTGNPEAVNQNYKNRRRGAFASAGHNRPSRTPGGETTFQPSDPDSLLNFLVMGKSMYPMH